MKQKTNPALIAALKDDPWFGPDIQIDASGLGPEFRPISEETDDFTVPLVNERAQSKSGQLHDALINNPEILQELADKPFKTHEELEVLKQYERNPAFSFYVNGFKVDAKYDRGSWHCAATHEDSGDRKSFKLGGIDRFDKDSVMTQCSRYLAPKKPWRELSESELDIVSRIASGGSVAAMLDSGQQFVAFALDRYSADGDFDPWQEKFRPLYTEAAWFAFREAHVDLTDADIDWMDKTLAGRAVTVNSLIACYELLENERKNQKRSRLFDSMPMEPEQSLDELSDEQLKSLRLKTLRLKNQN